MHALVDGDIPLYSCGFAAQKNKYSVGYTTYGDVVCVDCDNKKEANKIAEQMEGEVFTTIEVEPLANALHNVDTLMNKILETTLSDTFGVFISGKGNFREGLVDNYKANRDPTHKPHWYSEIKSHLIRNYGAVVVDGQEADDAMSIAQWASFRDEEAEPTIICTIDKDLDMVPGYHYNWNKDEIYEVGLLQGTRCFYKQIIKGDKSVDNIDGLYHLTKKKATKKVLAPIESMEDEKDMWSYVLGLFEGIDEDVVITNARLLWMRREEDEIWSPPQEPSEEVYGQTAQVPSTWTEEELQEAEGLDKGVV